MSGQFDYPTPPRFFARPDVPDMFAGACYSDIRISPALPNNRLSRKIRRVLSGDLVINGLPVRARNSTSPAA